MVKLLLILLSIGCASPDVYNPDRVSTNRYGIRKMRVDRALKFTNPVQFTRDLFGGYGVEVANQVYRRQGQKHIYMLINSDGGSMDEGRFILQAIKLVQDRGTEVVCLSTKAAHSMAFLVFAHCNRRYALASTQYLIHEARFWVPPGISEVVKEGDFFEGYKRLKNTNDWILNYIKESSGIADKVIRPGFYNEKVWTTRELEKYTYYGWITIITSVKGFKDIFNYHSNKRLKWKRRN